jgi:hypothetical protein
MKTHETDPSALSPEQEVERVQDFEHRYQVVRTAFWWRVKIGDGANMVGRCYTELDAQRLAAALLTAFRDGQFVGKAEAADLLESLRSRVAEKDAEIERLTAAMTGDATLAGLHYDQHGGAELDIGLSHPLVALMADALAKMIGNHNYVEMRMTHRETGDPYLILCQHLARPTPHELRQRAESSNEALKLRVETLEGALRELMRLKDLRDSLANDPCEWRGADLARYDDYTHSKPAAMNAARALLSQEPKQ